MEKKGNDSHRGGVYDSLRWLELEEKPYVLPVGVGVSPVARQVKSRVGEEYYSMGKTQEKNILHCNDDVGAPRGGVRRSGRRGSELQGRGHLHL